MPVILFKNLYSWLSQPWKRTLIRLPQSLFKWMLYSLGEWMLYSLGEWKPYSLGKWKPYSLDEWKPYSLSQCMAMAMKTPCYCPHKALWNLPYLRTGNVFLQKKRSYNTPRKTRMTALSAKSLQNDKNHIDSVWQWRINRSAQNAIIDWHSVKTCQTHTQRVTHTDTTPSLQENHLLLFINCGLWMYMKKNL